ncbi:right-handed parallel beta-helix repeat-containing protein [Haladaptatus sp. DYF46]|uniref:right-handed parallel beta-helix repeat-containing protein n=1 Tax=Haladaptatus sp. DYF46 TaxID=2886041 RepID=UPI001E426BE5|nr:right-handed parallel beta-helix repeat-containing protein [Haladaptatus sp. DYF46]
MPDIPRRRVLGGTAGLAFALTGWGAGDGRANDTRRMRTIADSVVTTTDELESTFENLSSGETVLITAKNAPYRTTGWLDIDADDVTVVGPGVRTLIKSAPSANAGGFRIGHRRHCSNVTIRGIGFDGNPDEQSIFTKLCHGIVVKDAEDVTLAGNYVTRTHPYHEHSTGGSGISAEPASRNVRIVGNRIEDIGDRGIQVGGTRVVVARNVVTDGLDRSISCDVWRNGRHRQGGNIAVIGNVLGNNPEGSLVGMGGDDLTDGGGYVVISDNLGFGHHKSFCHLGFEGTVRNVRIDGNVSVQERRDDYSGISLDIERAEHVTAVDNDLYGYGGRGINVSEGISDFVVSRNRIRNVASDGIRIAGAEDGVVARNTVSGTGRTGIILEAARYVAVEGNRFRDLERVGILAAGGETFHEISDNHVRGFATGKGHEAGMLIQSERNLVRHNRIYRSGGPAIVEGNGANNLYDGNWSDAKRPWHIRSATSRVRDHTPAFDVHRGVSVDGSGRATVEFEKPYATRPKLSFGRVGGGVRGVSYRTTNDGDFDAARLTVASPDSTVDVFVEPV